MARGRFRVAPAEPFAHRPAGAKKSNPDSRFRPALLFCNLLDFEALQIVALQHHPVIMLASLQNAADIDRRQVDLRRRRELRQRLKQRFTTNVAAVNVESDAVHPSQHHGGIAQLSQSFPTLHPCGLRSFLRGVIRKSSRNQEPDRQIEALLVRLPVFFSRHKRCSTRSQKNFLLLRGWEPARGGLPRLFTS